MDQHMSVLQLKSVINLEEEKNIARKLKTNAKAYSMVGEKESIPLYAEPIHLLVKRADWLVTKIYQHFTFVQSKFKKEFVIMNQKSR